MFDANDFSDKFVSMVEKAKDAFRKAADAETGNAKPLFQELYDDFSDKFDNPTDGNNYQEMIQGFLKTINLQKKLADEAKINPAAKETLETMQREIGEAFKGAMDLKSLFNKFGGMGSLGGIDLGKLADQFGGFGKKGDQESEKKNDEIKGDAPPNKKNKPKDGDFKI